MKTKSGRGGATLGQTLRAGRARRELSLRDVERTTGISNGYLSLLESDAVKEPSPKFLHQLADAYGVAYSLLMELAGYVAPDVAVSSPRREVKDPFSDLSDEERSQVHNFVNFLRASRKGSDRR